MGTGIIGFAWPRPTPSARRAPRSSGRSSQERGWPVEDTNVEYIGYNSLLGAQADPTYRDQLNECFLRMTIRTQDRKVADGFGRLFPWLGLSGPPYVGSMKGVQPRQRAARHLADAGQARTDRVKEREIAVEKV